MKKICSCCNQAKNIETDFSKKTETKLQSKCKECARKYSKEHYRKNRKKYLERNILYDKRIKVEYAEKIASLKDFPCMDCGIKYPRHVMDFDHREGEKKVGAIAILIRRKTGLKTLLAEVAKCDVVCSNCHRERTYQRRIAKIKTF